VRDAPNGPAWSEALQKAKFVCAVAMFEDASTRHADVVFPADSYAETEGTVTHPDGRLQRVRPGVEKPGRVRDTWEVLAELSAMLGEETGFDSVPEAFAAVASEVPFYAGLTVEEIGGLGVRWQDREAAKNFPSAPGESATGGPDEPPAASINGGIRVGTYRDLWAAEVTDRSPALRFLRPRQTLELAPADAERLGVGDAQEVDVRQNGTSIGARVAVRERVRPGSGFLVEGLGDGAGALFAEQVEVALPGGEE
jgi:NADH-quinone oxidoreductase subunit G